MNEHTQLFTMTKEGKFRHTKDGEYGCGAFEVGTRFDIKYNFSIETEPVLDEHGFLFDHKKIDDFFQGTRKEEGMEQVPNEHWRAQLSLESLTNTLLNRLTQEIKREHPHVILRNASLTLTPEPFTAGFTSKREFKPTLTQIGKDGSTTSTVTASHTSTHHEAPADAQDLQSRVEKLEQVVSAMARWIVA